jgi:hypothetical protein
MKRRFLLWIVPLGGVVSGCVDNSQAWKPLTPGDIGTPPVVTHSAPAARSGRESLVLVRLPAPTRWRIPSGRGSSRHRLYSQPQPELGPLPPPGPAAPVNPLFPSP